MTAIARDRLDIGRVINRTFGAIGGNLVTFLILAGILAGVPAVGSLYLVGWMQQIAAAAPSESAGSFQVIGISLIAGLIGIVSSYVLMGAITHGSMVFYNGRRASIGECLATGLRYVLPLIGLGILVGLGVAIGMLLLIVPGIIAALMWSVAAPVLVVEGVGIGGAISRSQTLTKNHRWAILGLVVIYAIISWLVQLVAFLPLGLDRTTAISSAYYGLQAPLMFLVLNVVYTVIVSTVSAAGSAALYSELRMAKEGVSSDELAKVFE